MALSRVYFFFLLQSDGISQTYSLAERYAKEAVKQISKLGSSPEKLALEQITRAVVQRRS